MTVAACLPCRYCERDTPVDELVRDSSKPRGFKRVCKPCERDRKRSAYAPKPRAPKPALPECSVEGCERVSHTRGMCRPHYRKVTDRPPAKVPNDCGDCGVVFMTAKKDMRDRCPSCQKVVSARLCRETWEQKRASMPPKPAPEPVVHTLTCARCGGPYQRDRRGTKYCSSSCRREASLTQQGCRYRACKRCGTGLGEVSLKLYCEECRDIRLAETRKLANRRKRKPWDRNHRSRARHYGVPYEPFSKKRVFDRDGWMCGICGLAVNPGVKYPDRMSPSLDHIVPMAKGGGHTFENAQLAHFICNSIKSDRLPLPRGSTATAA